MVVHPIVAHNYNKTHNYSTQQAKLRESMSEALQEQMPPAMLFALVLHPKFWGWGRKIFEKVIARAFNEMKLNSITVLFPPSRTNSKAIKRMGFVEDGELNVDGALFMRFRLTKASHKDSYSNLV